jgi:hypothetical protein
MAKFKQFKWLLVLFNFQYLWFVSFCFMFHTNQVQHIIQNCKLKVPLPTFFYSSNFSTFLVYAGCLLQNWKNKINTLRMFFYYYLPSCLNHQFNLGFAIYFCDLALYSIIMIKLNFEWCLLSFPHFITYCKMQVSIGSFLL